MSTSKPIPEVDVVDATGAGGIYAGAFPFARIADIPLDVPALFSIDRCLNVIQPGSKKRYAPTNEELAKLRNQIIRTLAELEDDVDRYLKGGRRVVCPTCNPPQADRKVTSHHRAPRG